MTKRVLIANRGEIAVRVARAVKELGWEPITIYTRDDFLSPHVKAGKIAVEVESYVSIDSIVDAAVKTNADIIHPGYGFLSENPDFARAVLRAGISWAGPPPKVMEVLGDKSSAKKIAERAGVPTLSWCVARGEEEAVKCAERIGLPVVLKASKAGGGRGMRVANSLEEVRRAYKLIDLEARRGFGNGGVIFVEKYIERPRHIEVQVLGDKYGYIVHLYERECTIQRRRQKIIEEAPSPYVERSRQLRNILTDYALRLAESVGYESTGTMEFVVSNGKPYFIEANTRLQVEHGVTEMVTGIDIVKLQLLVADGKELPFRQEDVKLRGWAVEARVYAEDPENGFVASEGILTRVRLPYAPGVRVDAAIEEGLRINTRYDTLLAKIIAWGSTRGEAVTRLYYALNETVIAGVKTNLDLLRAIVGRAWFRSGNYHTGILDEKLEELLDEISLKKRALQILIKALNGTAYQAAASSASRTLVRLNHGWPWPPWR